MRPAAAQARARTAWSAAARSTSSSVLCRRWRGAGCPSHVAAFARGGVGQAREGDHGVSAGRNAAGGGRPASRSRRASAGNRHRRRDRASHVVVQRHGGDGIGVGLRRAWKLAKAVSRSRGAARSCSASSTASSKPQFIPWPWKGTMAWAASPSSRARPSRCQRRGRACRAGRSVAEKLQVVRHQRHRVGEVAREECAHRRGIGQGGEAPECPHWAGTGSP